MKSIRIHIIVFIKPKELIYAEYIQGLIERPRRRLLRGQAIANTYAFGIAVKDTDCQCDRSRCIQVLSSREIDDFHAGYAAYVFQAPDMPEEAKSHIISSCIPYLINVTSADEITSGDIIEVNAPINWVNVLHFVDSIDYTILLTNRCNCNCLMCPDTEYVRSHGHDVTLEWIERYISLISPNVPHLTLTGGEPTMLKENLFNILDLCRLSLPDTRYLLLTNGRLFYYADYARRMALCEEYEGLTCVVGILSQEYSNFYFG